METKTPASGAQASGSIFQHEPLATKLVDDPSAILCGGCVNTGCGGFEMASYDTPGAS
jgi:hypothetical protein